MICTALKSFPFSRDGVTTELAEQGARVDIPSALVPGLVAYGFLGEADGLKATVPVENKAISRAEEVQTEPLAPENKREPARRGRSGGE